MLDLLAGLPTESGFFMPVPTLDITEEMKIDARAWDSAMMNWTAPRGGSSKTQLNKNAIDRWYHGAVGEYLFRQFLEDNHRPYEYHQVVGRSDNGDFIVPWYDGTHKVLDAKTLSKPYHHYFLLNAKQTEKKIYDYYISARLLSDDVGELGGYAKFSELLPPSKKKGYDPAYWLPLTKLHDLRKFLEWIPMIID